MWCRNCNVETHEIACPICGQKTEEDIPIDVLWCNHCQIPIICAANEIEKKTCPLCDNKTHYLATDLRPVFPEERLLLELLLKKQPNSLVDKSVWAANSRYYINGKSVSVSSKCFQDSDTDYLAEQLRLYSSHNS